jgi:Mn2+/Fe2+ NRAMP family transporter
LCFDLKEAAIPQLSFAAIRPISLDSSIAESLGPGIITGAADDDPSGIATYSVAGAQLGTKLLWTALLTWPLMAAVQMMCARIGKVTGQGLAANFQATISQMAVAGFRHRSPGRKHHQHRADLAGMADAASMLSGINSHWFVVVRAPYLLGNHPAPVSADRERAQVAGACALRVPHYRVCGGSQLGPGAARYPDSVHAAYQNEWATLVAILGTTISPYLFFWQASEEVEEEKSAGQSTLAKRRGATSEELELRNIDVGVGAFFSNMVMFFIILTTAITLNRHGITNIETSRQAAEALRPLPATSPQPCSRWVLSASGFLPSPRWPDRPHTPLLRLWDGARA